MSHATLLINRGTLAPSKPFPLNMLPNQEGFEFIGYLKGGLRAECRVMKDEYGRHYVAGAAFEDLVGWRYPATLDNLLR